MAPVNKLNIKDKVEDGEIDLSMCDLQDVPVKEIAQVTKAHTLDLSNNHLTLLPKNFTTLTHIIKLDLSKNELNELPDSFGNLVKLKHLDLYKNQLQHLPLSFSKLKALRWLDLKDNPLVPAVKDVAGLCLDSKQCQQCAKNIVNFYANLETKVIMERESREKQRQKDKLAQEQENKKLKKQEKKANKKKDNKTNSNSSTNKSKNQNGNNGKENNQQLLNNENNQERNSFQEEDSECSSATLYSLLKFVISMGILLCFVLFFLTSINSPNTRFITKEINSLWNQYLNLDSIPTFVKTPSVFFAEYFKAFHSNCGKGIKYVGEFVLHVEENETVQTFYKNFVDIVQSFIYTLKNYYKSVFK